MYNSGIYFYGFLIRIAGLFNPKANKWVSGRKNFWKNLPSLHENKKVVWFHCASLGEYDQGKPIMEEWRRNQPKDYILVTFFSPSGYEHIKDKSVGDFTCYLPLDTPKNAKRFISYFKPATAFFVKYEFWYNYLNQSRNINTKIYLISASFRKNQVFFKWYGKTFRRSLLFFNHIFVQQEKSKQLLSNIEIKNVTISGDTRYDRVLQRSGAKNSNSIIETWVKEDFTFIIGSSWAADEDVIFPAINNLEIKNKIIIAPHEIDRKRIAGLSNKLNVSHQLYTDIQKGFELKETTKVLILDCIGVLAEAYRYGNIAYIGGGFGTGLHNILEPAAFGLPVIFGPQHKKFPEAQEFIDNKIGLSCDNKDSFLFTYKFFSQDSEIKSKVRNFMQIKKGATKIVMDYILKDN